MNPLSVEDFERHVVSTLQSGLKTALDGIAAQYLAQDRADGLADPDGTSWVTLIAPVRTSGSPNGFGDYYPGGTDIPTAWPSIEAAVPDLEFDNFDIAQIDADGTLQLVVQIWLKDGRFPVLNAMMKRYAAAVYDVLKVPNALGDASIERVRFAWRTNPENVDANARITAGVLVFFTLNTASLRV